MNKFFLLLSALIGALTVPTTSSAALSSAMDGIAGYYEVYDGRLAGWLNTTDGDWLMFTNPNISDTMSLAGTVSTYPEDLSATLYQDPALYDRAGWLIDFTVGNVGWGPGMPSYAAAQLNAAIWNIFNPGSVPLDTTNGDPYDINWMYNATINGIEGGWNRSNYLWILTTQSGNEVLGVYGFSQPPESVSQTPIPASVWLLGTGLVGLIGVARCRKSA